MNSDIKLAATDHPIFEPIARRWSPYGYADTPVDEGELASLFEAARWAASSFNEQPWRFIVARKGDRHFDRILSTLAPPNQKWAGSAPVLALSVARTTFARNDKDNRTARYDLGQAMANLAVQAAALDLTVHQMAGVDTEAAAKEFAVPSPFEVVTAFAVGYAQDPPAAEQDQRPRSRLRLNEFVFGSEWERAADFD